VLYLASDGLPPRIAADLRLTGTIELCVRGLEPASSNVRLYTGLRDRAALGASPVRSGLCEDTGDINVVMIADDKELSRSGGVVALEVPILIGLDSQGFGGGWAAPIRLEPVWMAYTGVEATTGGVTGAVFVAKPLGATENEAAAEDDDEEMPEAGEEAEETAPAEACPAPREEEEEGDEGEEEAMKAELKDLQTAADERAVSDGESVTPDEAKAQADAEADAEEKKLEADEREEEAQRVAARSDQRLQSRYIVWVGKTEGGALQMMLWQVLYGIEGREGLDADPSAACGAGGRSWSLEVEGRINVGALRTMDDALRALDPQLHEALVSRKASVTGCPVKALDGTPAPWVLTDSSKTALGPRGRNTFAALRNHAGMLESYIDEIAQGIGTAEGEAEAEEGSGAKKRKGDGASPSIKRRRRGGAPRSFGATVIPSWADAVEHASASKSGWGRRRCGRCQEKGNALHCGRLAEDGTEEKLEGAATLNQAAKALHVGTGDKVPRKLTADLLKVCPCGARLEGAQAYWPWTRAEAVARMASAAAPSCLEIAPQTKTRRFCAFVREILAALKNLLALDQTELTVGDISPLTELFRSRMGAEGERTLPFSLGQPLQGVAPAARIHFASMASIVSCLQQWVADVQRAQRGSKEPIADVARHLGSQEGEGTPQIISIAHDVLSFAVENGAACTRCIAEDLGNLGAFMLGVSTALRGTAVVIRTALRQPSIADALNRLKNAPADAVTTELVVQEELQVTGSQPSKVEDPVRAAFGQSCGATETGVCVEGNFLQSGIAYLQSQVAPSDRRGRPPRFPDVVGQWGLLMGAGAAVRGQKSICTPKPKQAQRAALALQTRFQHFQAKKCHCLLNNAVALKKRKYTGQRGIPARVMSELPQVCTMFSVADAQSSCPTTGKACCPDPGAASRDGLEFGTLDVLIRSVEEDEAGHALIEYRVRATPGRRDSALQGAPREMDVEVMLRIGEHRLIDTFEGSRAANAWPEGVREHLTVPLDVPKGGPLQASVAVGHYAGEVLDADEPTDVYLRKLGQLDLKTDMKNGWLARRLMKAAVTKGLGDFLQEINGVAANGGYVDTPKTIAPPDVLVPPPSAGRLMFSNDRPAGERVVLLLTQATKDSDVNPLAIGGFVQLKTNYLLGFRTVGVTEAFEATKACTCCKKSSSGGRTRRRKKSIGGRRTRRAKNT
jgi:hypothetical protein